MLLGEEVKYQDVERFGNGGESGNDSRWKFGNDILYEMCRNYPEHKRADVIVGKLWLIGRAYAAAIERRKDPKEEKATDDFYFNVVANEMLKIGEELDNRIGNLKKYDVISNDNLEEIVSTHKFLTDIFKSISGQYNRSLASKYLHFHVPNMFYIYDSRAIELAKKLIRLEKNDKKSKDLSLAGDDQYIDLVKRLIFFQEYVKCQFGVTMTPRQIDSYLLNY